MTQRDLESALDPTKLEGLLAELAGKNTVRVVKHTPSSRPFVRSWMKKVMDEDGVVDRVGVGWITRLDELRHLAGLPARYLQEALDLQGGVLIDVSANLRTTVGIDYVADSLGNSSSRPAVANFMALTESATAPVVGDTTLPAEITTNGLARVAATYAHTAAATLYTLQKAFTASGVFTAVQRDGIFNASSVGTLYVSAIFTLAALQIGDQLTVTHTVNI